MQKSINITKTRDPYFDIIKGVAIMLVVAGHCIQYGNGAEFLCDKEYFENLMFRCIYSFHMPLFMLICGYFFYSSASKRSFVKVVSNKCKTVLLPIISFGVVSFLIWKVPEYSSKFSFESVCVGLRDCSNHTRQSLWFFWALFKLSIIVAIIQKGLKDNEYVHVIVLLLVFIFPIPKITELEKSVYPFFLLGYWTKKYNWWNKLQHINKKNVLTFLGVTYIICLYYFHKDTYVYTTGITIWNSKLGHYQIIVDIQRLLTGLCGSLLCLFLIKIVYDKVRIESAVKVFSFLGIYSGGIYCVHSALIPVDRFALAFPDNMISGGVIFIPVLIYSVAITWLFSKSKFTDYLFLGGR